MQSESPAEEKQRRESQDGPPRDHPGGSSSANAASPSKIENFLKPPSAVGFKSREFKEEPGVWVWVLGNEQFECTRGEHVAATDERFQGVKVCKHCRCLFVEKPCDES